MTRKEVFQALADGKEVEYDDGFGWAKSRGISFDCESPWFACYWRIKPVAKPVPMGPDDIPAVCWVRYKKTVNASEYLVIMARKENFAVYGCSFGWGEASVDLEYSTDRKVWKAMVKV